MNDTSTALAVYGARGGLMGWLSRPTSIYLLLAILALPLLALQFGTSFSRTGFFLPHDEAEHLRVVFALERGEIPYRDFIENHPVLFHLGLLGLKNALGIHSTMGLYWLATALVAAHAAAGIVLLSVFYHRFSRRHGFSSLAWIGVPIVLALLQVWTYDYAALEQLWELRPDWICYFYAFLCIALHYEFHRRLFEDRAPGMWRLVVGAVAGGFATAILAKSIYVFLPYGLTLALLMLDRPRERLAAARVHWHVLVQSNVLFLALGMLSFVAFLLIELRLSGVTFGEYYRANFLMNAIKHLTVRVDDTNPFNVLRNFLGLSLLPTLALMLATAVVILRAYRKNHFEMAFTLIFIVLVMLINAMLPAYSNGLLWPQYFIPTLLMLILVLAILLERTIYWACHPASGTMLRLGERSWWLPLGVVAVLSASLLFKWQLAAQEFAGARSNSELRERLMDGSEEAFVVENYLWPDLTYLAFAPQSVPVRARTWGYFFMLSPDDRLWVDNHALGIGPDPSDYWRTLYAKERPEVIVVTDENDFRAKSRLLKRRQKVDLEWLWPKLLSDYRCVQHKQLNTLRVQLRNDRLQYMNRGWQFCQTPFLKKDDNEYP